MRFIIWLTGSGRLAQECNSRFESGVGFIQVSSKTDQKTINSFLLQRAQTTPHPTHQISTARGQLARTRLTV